MEPKRRLILDAALKLFSRHGYRRTTVDEIAREAEIGKGTIYLHFADKEAVFQALVVDFGDQLAARTQAALTEAKDPAETLRALLEAKFLLSFRILHSAPHAQDLIDSSNRLAGEVVDRCARQYREELEAFVEKKLFPARPSLRALGGAKEFVTLLLAAGDGLARQVDSEKALTRLLDMTARLIVATPAKSRA